jgi:hypothetical protein
MGLETVAAGAMIGGNLLNSGFGYMNQRANRRQANDWRNYMMQQIQGQMVDPNQRSPYEDILAQYMTPMGRFNMGQDGGMQALRADGNRQMNAMGVYQDIMRGGGNPFDTSEMFRALGAVDDRQMANAVAQMRAGATGLGQRFGGAMLNQEADLRRDMLQNLQARNAGIQSQAYEAAQGRLMGAADASQAAIMQMIQQGYGMSMGNRQMNAQLLGMLSGQQPVPYSQNPLGQMAMDAGQSYLMWRYMQSLMGGAPQGSQRGNRTQGM